MTTQATMATMAIPANARAMRAKGRFETNAGVEAARAGVHPLPWTDAPPRARAAREDASFDDAAARLALAAVAFAEAAGLVGTEGRSFPAVVFLRGADAFAAAERAGAATLPFGAFIFGAAAFDAVGFAGFALFARRYVGLAAREAEEFDFRL